MRRRRQSLGTTFRGKSTVGKRARRDANVEEEDDYNRVLVHYHALFSSTLTPRQLPTTTAPTTTTTIRTTTTTMMAPDSRSGDRTSYYTVKTPGRSQPSPAHAHVHTTHSRSNSLSQQSHAAPGQSHNNSHQNLSHSSQSHSYSVTTSQSFFANKSTTPMASPRLPYSAGQQYPPRLSPGATNRMTAPDVRAPSPNYFGLPIETVADPRDSAAMPRENWSPSSSVKSFAAVLPKQMPLDANPEFEAFRRQVDANRGRAGFNLSSSHMGGTQTGFTPSAAQRPRPPRWHTHASDTSESSLPRLSLTGATNQRVRELGTGKQEADGEHVHDSAYVSAESKRNSEASLNPPSFLNMGRQESPAQMESPFGAPEQGRQSLSKVDDRHPRLSMMHDKANPPSPDPKRHHPRAATVPLVSEPGSPSMLAPTQVKDLLESVPANELLLLDLRVSPMYAQARIKGALNLCIPTTLLKRATFNLEKLQQTFQAEHDQEKFANWRRASYLIVYEAHSSDKRDAVPAMNTIKKFTNEGYSGNAAILKGGFNSFASAYPNLVDSAPTTVSGGKAGGGPSLSLAGPSGGLGATKGNDRPAVAPVVGGVMLPMSTNSANPFFSNIRQNQDLVDGVGQMDISMPAGMDSDSLPRWLREAADRNDHGKKVSNQFLKIELAEQSRMKAAYSSFIPALDVKQNPAAELPKNKVQLSGLEKGGKNRYKDILPFEHARVRLQGKPEGACDYVNASHVQASRSYKRYIASQGPLPATFEDFWSVIWDQDVRVIVMLTAESEGGQLKCHPYWQGKEFGPIKLKLLSEQKVSLDIDKHRSGSGMSAQSHPTGSSHSSSSHNNNTTNNNNNRDDENHAFSWNMTASAETGRRRANTTTMLGLGAPTPATASQTRQTEPPFAIIRRFSLLHAAHPFTPMREITHIHYSSWPDFGAPAQPSHLLALVELSNAMQRNAGPVDVAARIASAVPGVPGASMGATGSSSDPSKRPRSNALRASDEPEGDANARPMLVHCSAGCGRTGTFCTVDSVIDMLKRQRLRAARHAELRVARREERVARLTNMQDAWRGQDAEGDVAMQGIGPDEELSPLARTKPPATSFTSSADFTSPGSTDGSRFFQPPGPIPDELVADDDDNVDLPEDDAVDGLDMSWQGDESVDLVARTVEDFREQRLSMVQSLRQFVLCYETVIEWIHRVQEMGSAGGGGGAAGIGFDGRLRARTGSLAFF